MSRKRSLSTEISTDPRLEELAERNISACLLYTWAIPHADDWGRMTGDARQFRLLVCPSLPLSSGQVEEALETIADLGLWQRYEVEGRSYIAFPEQAWFKWQSYIASGKRETDKSHFPPPPGEQRRKTPQNAKDRQATPQNPSSPSPSPSPSLTPSLSLSLSDNESLVEGGLGGIEQPPQTNGSVSHVQEITGERSRCKDETVQHTIAECPLQDPVAVALDYADWQDGLPVGKRDKNRTRGWRNAMYRARERGWFLKNGSGPTNVLPMRSKNTVEEQPAADAMRHYPSSGIPLWDKIREDMALRNTREDLPCRHLKDWTFEDFPAVRLEGDTLVIDPPEDLHPWPRQYWPPCIETVARFMGHNIHVKWSDEPQEMPA